MNSIPVQLPLLGAQVNVLGAGAQSSAAGDTAAGSDGFLGLLQQMLLGGALQMTVAAPTTPQENGTAGTEGNGSGGDTPPADGLTVVSVGTSVVDQLTAQPPGTAVQQTSTRNGNTVAAVQTATAGEGPSAETSTATAATDARPVTTVASANAAQAMETILTMMEPVTDVQTTVPEVPVVSTTTATSDQPTLIVPAEVRDVVTPGVVPGSRDEEKTSQAVPKSGKPAAEAKPVRRAGTLASSDLTSKVPVSPKEGDKMQVRAQATAPASMEEAVASEDLRRMVRVLQHVAGSGEAHTADAGDVAALAERVTVPVTVKETEADASPSSTVREQDGAALKAVPSASHTGQDTFRDAMQHREQTFTPPASPLTKIETTRTAEFAGRLPETLASLPQETAKSVADQVIKGMALQVNGENSEVRIKLVPESLGEVTVHVRMEGGKMQAQIDVSQVGVKSALEVQLPQIRQSLSERGIDVQRLDVSFGGDHPARESGGGQGDRRQRQGSRRAYEMDPVEQVDTGRLMGYNTMEMVM
jgi:flagellar hook-length control protein FliK